MPSALPLPTIAELLKAFDDAVVGQKEPRANVRRGSCYDHFAGVGAILFSRQAQRDRDLFRAIYFDTADGDDLTNLGATRFTNLAARATDTYGTGLATLTRPTASAGGGTIYQGTRISVISLVGTSELRSYVVSQDTPVGATSTSVSVPVRAAVTGAGTSIAATSGGTTLLRLEDGAFDATLSVQSAQCGDGTSFEQAKDYRARVRQGRLDTRKGYTKAIFTTLAALGATNVVAFPSNYTSDANDFGLNYVYVGDGAFAATPALVTSCALALDNVAVYGTQIQVLPMTSSAVTVSATVSLWDDPGSFNLTSVAYDLKQALVAYFDGRANAFTYRLDAMAGAMSAASAAVQSVTFTSPTADQSITTGSPPQFPATLARTTLSAASVFLSFQGPS